MTFYNIIYRVTLEELQDLRNADFKEGCKIIDSILDREYNRQLEEIKSYIRKLKST